MRATGRCALVGVLLSIALTGGCSSCARDPGLASTGTRATPRSMLPGSHDLDTAMDMLQDGRGPEGEALLVARIDRAGAEHGQQSPERAAALFEIASFYLAEGERDRAIDSLRASTDIPSVDFDSEQARLTHLLNLGEFLLSAGRLEEAEAVQRRGLEGRESHYGRSHAGYAFGLQGLADVLVAEEHWDEATPLVDEAIVILRGDHHPRVGALLGLRACIAVGRDPGATPSLGALRDVDPETFLELITQIDLAERTDPEHWAPIAIATVPLVEARDGIGSEPAVRLAWRSVALTTYGDHLALRRTAAEQLVRVADTSDRLDAHVESRLELAYAQSQTSDELARTTYESAVAIVDGVSPQTTAHALRELGLHLERTGDVEGARARLEAAIETARTAGEDPTRMWGRVAATLGVFRLHHGAAQDAIPMLREGMDHLPDTHPDALVAASHLRAAERGEPCDCRRDMPIVTHDLMLQRARAVGGDAVIDVAQSGDHWSSVWATPPSDDDRQRVDIALRHVADEATRTFERVYGRSTR